MSGRLQVRRFCPLNHHRLTCPHSGWGGDEVGRPSTWPGPILSDDTAVYSINLRHGETLCSVLVGI